jgi:hypothetical protein
MLGDDLAAVAGCGPEEVLEGLLLSSDIIEYIDGWNFNHANRDGANWNAGGSRSSVWNKSGGVSSDWSGDVTL